MRSSLVNLGIGISQFNRNVTFQFVLEADGLDSGDGLDDGGFTVGDVTDCAYVDGCLA
jgi:hypothetical protein